MGPAGVLGEIRIQRHVRSYVQLLDRWPTVPLLFSIAQTICSVTVVRLPYSRFATPREREYSEGMQQPTTISGVASSCAASDVTCPGVLDIGMVR